MSAALPQTVADRLYRAVVDGYDAAAAAGRGERFLSRLAILLAVEVGVPDRVVELIALANHDSANHHVKGEAA